MKIRKIAIFMLFFALIWNLGSFDFHSFSLTGMASAKIKKIAKPKKIKKSKTKPASFVLPVKIIGDASCVEENKKAFGLLKEKAPVHYETALKYIGAVECAASGSGVYVMENPPRYKVGAATIAAGTIWLSGTIAHEACHSKLYHDYLESHPLSSVPSEAYSGREAEKQCLDVQYDALQKMGADSPTLNYERSIIDTEYWNVSYAGRWW